MASAWGSSWGSAWGSSWGSTAAAVTGGGGGWIIDAPCLRDRLKLYSAGKNIPEKVCKVIERVVEQQLEEPSNPEAALHRALERKNLAYRAYYAEALRRELEYRRQEDEDILLLMLH